MVDIILFIWNILRVCAASKIVLQGMVALGGGFSAIRRSDNKNLLLIGLGILMAFYIHNCFHLFAFESQLIRNNFDFAVIFGFGRLLVDCLIITYGLTIKLDN